MPTDPHRDALVEAAKALVGHYRLPGTVWSGVALDFGIKKIESALAAMEASPQAPTQTALEVATRALKVVSSAECEAADCGDECGLNFCRLDVGPVASSSQKSACSSPM